MNPIKVVQLGTWKFAHGAHIMQCMRSMPHVYEILGVCEPDEACRKEAMKDPTYAGLKWLSLEQIDQLPELDAVIVETKEVDQAVDALPFAQKGIPIHLEKPGGSKTEDFEALIEAVKNSGSVLQAGYMYRYNPAILQAQKMVSEGKIGEIIRMDAQMSVRYDKRMLEMLSALPGGMMYYLGCHMIDLMYLFQGEPQEVYPFCRCSELCGTDAQDSGLTVYRYPKGNSTVRTMACEVGGGDRRGMVLTGTKGTIEIQNFEIPLVAPPITNANRTSLCVTYYPESHPTVLTTEKMTFSPYGRYDAMMLDFARMVKGEKKNPYAPEQELSLFRLLMRSF